MLSTLPTLMSKQHDIIGITFGVLSAHTMLRSVDFPAPFSPLNAQCSPFITVKLKSFKMVRSP